MTSVKLINHSSSTADWNYSYIYETAGEYDAVFVARNATFEGESKVVARLKITIAEPADNE